MKAIPVHNPSRNGKAFCSPKKAAYYLAHGRAVMRPDGTLQFTQANQDALAKRIDTERQAFDDAVLAGRQGMVYWNGAYEHGSYPPGCNNQFLRPDHRY